MFVEANKLRLTGRWSIDKNGCAVTTACGAMVEFAFKGKDAVLRFNMQYMKHPYPHLWICVDDGAYVESVINRYLRINCKEDCSHTVKIILKSSVEMQHRWYEPLEAKLMIEGIEINKLISLKEDRRPIIEFVGDSITEGVLIDTDYQLVKTNDFYKDQINRVFQNDVTSTYAYKAAELLNFRGVISGYGGVGITKAGSGGVPRAAEIYDYCCDNIKNNYYVPDYIVVNYGANDWNVSAEKYINGYEELLLIIRNKNKYAKIIVLSPFKGFFAEELKELVIKFNKNYNDSIYYIDSRGWIEKDPVHPTRSSHALIAEKLAEAFNLEVVSDT